MKLIFQKRKLVADNLHNSGYVKETKQYAKHMIEAFASSEYVVAPSGSCAMMVHEFSSLFSESEAGAAKSE